MARNLDESLQELDEKIEKRYAELMDKVNALQGELDAIKAKTAPTRVGKSKE